MINKDLVLLRHIFHGPLPPLPHFWHLACPLCGKIRSGDVHQQPFTLAFQKSRIEFVFFDAGGGHRSAATALQMAVESQCLPWDVHLFNLQEALDRLDLMKKISGVRIQDTYNYLLKTGMTLGSKQLMRVLQFTISIYHRPTVRILTRLWRESAPDMVVSFVPHFNLSLIHI